MRLRSRRRDSLCAFGFHVFLFVQTYRSAVRNMMSEQHHISAIYLDNTRKRSVFSRRFSECDGYICTNREPPLSKGERERTSHFVRSWWRDSRLKLRFSLYNSIDKDSLYFVGLCYRLLPAGIPPPRSRSAPPFDKGGSDKPWYAYRLKGLPVGSPFIYGVISYRK